MADKVKKIEEVKEAILPEITEEVQKETSVAKASDFAKATPDKMAAEGEESCENCTCDEKICEKCGEYKAKYLRAIADYQNLERRVQDQRIEWIKSGNKNVILKLLSFLDDLERAEVFIKDVNLSHIKDTFIKLLKEEGLEEVEVLDKPYDPYTAEVIDMKDGTEDNKVVSVLRKGYLYNGQLLRVAQVAVSKKA